MAHVEFHKFQGTGNDFIMIDNRGLNKSPDMEAVRELCHRRFGIGADGLILLGSHEGYDFEMIYYNADGRQSSMCGNGGRCIAAFADMLGINNGKYEFNAVDGPHQAVAKHVTDEMWHVELAMNDVGDISRVNGSDFILDTGSPHYVVYGQNIESMDVVTEGRKIRNSPPYIKDGINVNFIEPKGDEVQIRTYERGVEDETWSCGTGTVAGALVKALDMADGIHTLALNTVGGKLQVRFRKKGSGFTDIALIGPAVKVYSGTITI